MANNANDVPMMFRSQVSGRCQIQRLIPKQNRQDAEHWVEEWLKSAGNVGPEFSQKVKTREYDIAWRFVSNSGQDEGTIRPVIGARGWPYYPGASMKGAFLRACWAERKEGNLSPEKVLRYCGGEVLDRDGTKKTQPGILRFHGGYPKGEKWRNSNLIDVVHPQENWQVTGKNGGEHSALIQISLFEPTFVFGISATTQGEKEISEAEWETIWALWELALVQGIGCRVSAGYGQPKPRKLKNVQEIYKKHLILSVRLWGQGICSQLIDKSEEFRPNMFKAALRGHTLRLFSGLTDDASSQALTKELWGGFSGNGPVMGLLAIGFQPKELYLEEYKYGRDRIMPTYDLSHGSLNILTARNVSEAEKKSTKSFLIRLIKFSMLLGGFGKSWRRAHHQLFFPKYLTGSTKNNKNINPAIGCHWGFTERSQPLYIPIAQLADISEFLDKINASTSKWITKRGYKLSPGVSSYREAWHPETVQVWARFAENKFDSEAIFWFHDTYANGESIKKTNLTGWAAEKGRGSQISRIWHRMYPHYILGEDKKPEAAGKGYVELLTIFPDPLAVGDEKEKQEGFLEFLAENEMFTKVWPIKKG